MNEFVELPAPTSAGRDASNPAEALVAALGNLPLPFARFDGVGVLIEANPAFFDAVGGDMPELEVGSKIDAAVGLLGTAPWLSKEERADGTGWVALADGWIFLDPEAAPTVLVDPLTSLGTRQALQAQFRRASEEAGDRVLLCIDLDRFKPVNDTLGHTVGDELLRKVARRLERAVRGSERVCRVGGDEFALVLAGFDVGETAEAIAARIIDLLGRPFLISGEQIVIGASIGIAHAPKAASDRADGAAVGTGDEDGRFEEALRRADIALYETRRTAPGTFCWYEPAMSVAMRARRELETELRSALLLEQFELHFQPQFDLARSHVTGFEALARWNHPARGQLPPGAFIQAAEDNGMIVELGAWVLARACREAIRWPDHLSVAVNVSPLQFMAENFVPAVFDALEGSGLPARRLELEVTESLLLGKEDDVLARMEELRRCGVILSLDDFGVGYSSLGYLRDFPFDKVKIDQSFVRGPSAGETGGHIVDAVAQLGQAFGMQVLAEGVETVEQLNQIASSGCGAVQGYLIGRPIAASQIDDFLARIERDGVEEGRA